MRCLTGNSSSSSSSSVTRIFAQPDPAFSPMQQQITSAPKDETQKSTPQLDHHDHQHGWLHDTGTECGECGESFQGQGPYAFGRHLRKSSHRGVICLCGSRFTRPSALDRHIGLYSEHTPRHRCPRPGCKNHRRGKIGFARKDHLVQHLRGYHKENQTLKGRLLPTCPHPGCDNYREWSFHLQPLPKQIEDKPFENRTQYNKHMRLVHQESPISCRVPGCSASPSTVNALRIHFESEHPSLRPISNWSTGRPLELCPFPDCKMTFSPALAHWHLREDHSANL